MKSVFAATLAGLVLAAGSAAAAPVALTIGDFSVSDTVVDFGLVANEEAVGAAYAAQGVTFSGALYGMDSPGDLALFPNNGDGRIASNWLYSQGQHTGLSFTAMFSSLQNRVGFLVENWEDQEMTVELFDGATSLGVLALANTAGLDAEFRGVGDVAGFDRLVFTTTADTNGFFAIDNFTFNNGDIGAVPEPSTWAMLILGFGAAGAMIRRRRETCATA